MMESTEFESTELFEGLESENIEGESWERRGGRRFPTPPRASGKGLFTPRPTTNHVTQVQLQAALAKTGAQIKTNSDGITAINTRLNTVSAEQARVAGALRRESEERKKDAESQKKDLGGKLQMLALLPLLVKPTFTLPVIPAGGIATPTPLQPDSGNTLNALLPLLLVGGVGGSGGFGSSSDGGMDSGSMLILALVLSGGLK